MQVFEAHVLVTSDLRTILNHYILMGKEKKWTISV
jgi:hypothetical protein